MWDMLVLSTYLIISIAYLVLLTRKRETAKSDRVLKIISIMAFVTAILVHSVTAWIFSLNIARPFWNTALMAPWFVSSALVSGLALVLLLVIGLKKVGYLSIEQENLSKMGKLLGIFIAVDLFFFFCDILTGIFPGGGIHFEIIQVMLTGPLAPFFWTEAIGGIIALILMFNPKTRSHSVAILIAAILGIIGILCKRIQLIEGGFQIPNLSYPGVATGPVVPGIENAWQSLGNTLVYWPTGFEIFVSFGVLSLGVCLLFLGLAFLPIRQQRREVPVTEA